MLGPMAPARTFTRYVALGDSSTEGIDDPDGTGGYRGWADRFAERVAAANPGLLYANLAVRARTAGEIEATQLSPALAMRPDLATVVGGMNDLLRTNFDPVRVAGHVGTMLRALADGGATVLTFTLPDVSRRMRLPRRFAARAHALNVELRRCAAASGALLLDLANYELAADPRLWSVDRLHGNAEGHARIADEFAHLIGLPGAVVEPTTRLPPPPPRPRRDVVAEDVAWIVKFVMPWALRRLRGRTLGDGRSAKRPILTPIGDDARAR